MESDAPSSSSFSSSERTTLPNLPPEVLGVISCFYCIGLRCVGRFGLVCRSFASVVGLLEDTTMAHSDIWKMLFLKRYPRRLIPYVLETLNIEEDPQHLTNAMCKSLLLGTYSNVVGLSRRPMDEDSWRITYWNLGAPISLRLFCEKEEVTEPDIPLEEILNEGAAKLLMGLVEHYDELENGSIGGYSLHPMVPALFSGRLIRTRRRMNEGVAPYVLPPLTAFLNGGELIWFGAVIVCPEYAKSRVFLINQVFMEPLRDLVMLKPHDGAEEHGRTMIYWRIVPPDVSFLASRYSSKKRHGSIRVSSVVAVAITEPFLSDEESPHSIEWDVTNLIHDRLLLLAMDGVLSIRVPRRSGKENYRFAKSPFCGVVGFLTLLFSRDLEPSGGCFEVWTQEEYANDGLAHPSLEWLRNPRHEQKTYRKKPFAPRLEGECFRRQFYWRFSKSGIYVPRGGHRLYFGRGNLAIGTEGFVFEVQTLTLEDYAVPRKAW